MLPKVFLDKTSLYRFAIQAVFLLVVIAAVASAVITARANVDAQGLSGGFHFLERATGWSYSFSLIDQSVDDPYWRTLGIGFMNTLFLGLVFIGLATFLGFIIGAGRDSANFAVGGASWIFVHLFRNIPLILQLMFWYAVLIHLPSPNQALSIFDAAFLTNRGLHVPLPNVPAAIGFGLGVVAVASAVLLGNAFLKGVIRLPIFMAGLMWAALNVGLISLGGLLFAPEDTASFDLPRLEGLRHVGGLYVSVELVAMIVAAVLYGAAYIAEVVKGGLRGVPREAVEAGRALGMQEDLIWVRIKLPLALRSIVPPLGNQWIYLVKATTVGMAIGFSDLFMIISTSITQSGQTLELIGILVGAFLLINFSLARIVRFINGSLQLKSN